MPDRAADDWATVGAIGVAAYMIADVAHEAIGDGIACLAHGARISLLTSVYFRCSSRSPFVTGAFILFGVLLGHGIGLYRQ